MDVTNVIGDYGKFHRNVYLFTLLREAPSAFHLVIYSFFFPSVEHWCAVPETLVGNVTSEQWKTLMVSNSSLNADSSPGGLHQCESFDADFSEGGALRTYVGGTVPMGTLVGFAGLASPFMLLLPETFRVTLPDRILESIDMGNPNRLQMSDQLLLLVRSAASFRSISTSLAALLAAKPAHVASRRNTLTKMDPFA
ncbi:hypothetical protein HPB50_001291 [Hyalomma asiaticum]|uniref:Uncharacterized protein n=1 Tax=Hyalomma asiaticum TaxID=266040 RepID=A0ACB7RLU7_HYAAI|nr:hypothetical protein HPB50_001291 [Hyalomma asiaticum]